MDESMNRGASGQCGRRVAPRGGIVEVHLREVSQLFDPLDPSPFGERDLNRSTEDYLVESVQELPSRAPCALVVHIDHSTGLRDESAVGDAIRQHFARRSMHLRRELRLLIRRGLISLGIGLAFMGSVFLIAQRVDHLLGDAPLARLLREGLLIVGWVAMWRPLEIFLYDWWPIVGRRRLHDRLSRITVRVVSTGTAASGASGAECRMRDSLQHPSRE